jgi:hypothetical protein
MKAVLALSLVLVCLPSSFGEIITALATTAAKAAGKAVIDTVVEDLKCSSDSNNNEGGLQIPNEVAAECGTNMSDWDARCYGFANPSRPGVISIVRLKENPPSNAITRLVVSRFTNRQRDVDFCVKRFEQCLDKRAVCIRHWCEKGQYNLHCRDGSQNVLGNN